MKHWMELVSRLKNKSSPTDPLSAISGTTKNKGLGGSREAQKKIYNGQQTFSNGRTATFSLLLKNTTF